MLRATECLRLNESLLLLAGEAAEAVEALALAVAVVEAAVGALGELADGVLVVDVRGVALLDQGGGGARDKAAADREGAVTLVGGVDLEQVLHAGLPRLVGKSHVEGDVGGGGGARGGTRFNTDVLRAVALGGRD